MQGLHLGGQMLGLPRWLPYAHVLRLRQVLESLPWEDVPWDQVPSCRDLCKMLIAYKPSHRGTDAGDAPQLPRREDK